nr:MAG TPA: hypothetical protein [Caudoviricetes sp.]
MEINKPKLQISPCILLNIRKTTYPVIQPPSEYRAMIRAL